LQRGRDGEPLGGRDSEPLLAVEPQGRAIALWWQRNGIYANRFVPGLGWLGGEPIQAEGGEVLDAAVAVDARGGAIAAWVQSNTLWARRFDPDAPRPER
jgi:hypothetical protein